MSETAKKTRKLRAKTRKMDITFLSIVLILFTIGIVMLFSASYAYSLEYYKSSYVFIKKQLMYGSAGIIIMILVSHINYHFWRKLAWPIFGLSTILLILLLALPPMIPEKGVKRWLIIGPVNFQPSEIAKFAIILLFASLIAGNYSQMKKLSFISVLGVILLGTAALIVAEPHVSATLLVLLIGVVLLIVGGLPKKYIFGGGILGIAGIVLFFISGAVGYVKDRLQYWFDPWSDATGKGFQTIQSLLAIGSGGILGRGIGQSRQKYLWVPEPHNDFIFSIVCEELGLIGAAIIVILFCLLVWRGFYIAMHSEDKFGALLAVGLTFQVGLQAMLNILVVTNTVPNTGISLPFFSYGGTAIILLLAEMGIVLSVSRGSDIEKT